ncbi:carotenoid oxygenase family protein [Streptomyces mirabilis]|uniref:carotenoid oxygenase family protein n=1 Tax=Streptomyces mirabilis TaxID=68239 RepID=UPI003667F984
MRTPAVLAEEKVGRALWGGLDGRLLLRPRTAVGGPDPTATFDYVQWPRLALGDSETSQLLVFAAQETEAGPVARVRILVRVPLGLHGCRLPTEE